MGKYQYDPSYTWEYNLIMMVRWADENDAKDDVCSFIKNYIDEIAVEEGYRITKSYI
jgi:hypothetical protein